MPRIEPGAAGCEARMCYAPQPPSLKFVSVGPVGLFFAFFEYMTHCASFLQWKEQSVVTSP